MRKTHLYQLERKTFMENSIDFCTSWKRINADITRVTINGIDELLREIIH